MTPGLLPFPIYIVTKGNLWNSASRIRRTKDGERTYISTGIPVYTVEGLRKGIGMRQCTRTFKIEPVNKKLRELLGFKRLPKNPGVLVELWMGISDDEASRMKPSKMPWIKTIWPLIEKNMDRQDCLDWMEAHGYPKPPRSACTFCPFHDDDSWLALAPAEMADAVQKERELQSAYAESSQLTSIPYFHESRVPLDEVRFVPTPQGRPSKQLRLFNNECEGMCGV